MPREPRGRLRGCAPRCVAAPRSCRGPLGALSPRWTPPRKERVMTGPTDQILGSVQAILAAQGLTPEDLAAYVARAAHVGPGPSSSYPTLRERVEKVDGASPRTPSGPGRPTSTDCSRAPPNCATACATRASIWRRDVAAGAPRVPAASSGSRVDPTSSSPGTRSYPQTSRNGRRLPSVTPRRRRSERTRSESQGASRRSRPAARVDGRTRSPPTGACSAGWSRTGSGTRTRLNASPRAGVTTRSVARCTTGRSTSTSKPS